MIVEIKRDCVIANSVWLAGSVAEFSVDIAEAAIARGDAALASTDTQADEKAKKRTAK